LFIPKTLLQLLNDYIIDPLSNAFKPVTTFFKSIAEKVMGFFEDFGIPEMGFSVLGKKFSIGPYYPFRPEQGSNRVGGGSSMEETSNKDGETSTFKQSVVSSGGSEYTGDRTNETPAQKLRRDEMSKDKTNVLINKEVVKDGKATFDQNLATFDPATGKSTLSGDAVLNQREGTLAAGQESREISKRAFSKIKKEGLNDTGTSIADIVKEDDAYQKLSFFDKMKVDVGYAKATYLLVAASPTKTPTAEKVTQQSSDNAVAKMPTQTAPSNNNIVNAPVTTNNKTTQLIKSPTRNQESSQTKYLDSRYAF
jgi:hypothetical protein